MVSLSRKAAIVVIAPILIIGLIVLEIVSFFSLDRLPTVAVKEFPEIDRDLLDKFSSFDRELGWVPQPNTTKQKDTGDHLPGEDMEKIVEYSTDEYGSRVCPATDRKSSNELTVSTYGDSYCFCRGVNDNETFQHYLAEELDTHVGNYGAGNYGLDQALMRLKRQYSDDSTDYVLIVVTASSIARILSVWKHYQEIGNILAMKPRYSLKDGSLELIESPLDEKDDLLNLPKYAGFLRSHDYHYEHWFTSHLATFPYSSDFLQNPDHLRYSLYTALKDAESRLEISIPGYDFAKRQTLTEARLEEARTAYHDELFDEKEDLFSKLIGEFVSYSNEEDFTPVFAMVQQLRYARYEREKGPIYGNLLNRLDERYPDLITIDMVDHITDDDDVESLYVQRGEGGHYSPETNEKIANVMIDEAFADEVGEAGVDEEQVRGKQL
jgi:hypothetical protein